MRASAPVLVAKHRNSQTNARAHEGQGGPLGIGGRARPPWPVVAGRAGREKRFSQ